MWVPKTDGKQLTCLKQNECALCVCVCVCISVWAGSCRKQTSLLHLCLRGSGSLRKEVNATSPQERYSRGNCENKSLVRIRRGEKEGCSRVKARKVQKSKSQFSCRLSSGYFPQCLAHVVTWKTPLWAAVLQTHYGWVLRHIWGWL